MTDQPGWIPPSGPGGSGYGAPGGHGYGGHRYGAPSGAGGWAPSGGGGGYGPGPGWGGYGNPGGWGTPPVPQPGVVPLRPIGLGEILDGAVTSIWRNPRTTLGLAAIVMTVYGVISAAITLAGWSAGLRNIGTLPGVTQQITPAQARQIGADLLPLLLGFVVLAFLIDLLLTGMLTVVVGRSVLGHSVTPRRAWRAARPRLLPLLGAALLSILIFIVLWGVLIGISAGLMLASRPIGVVFIVVAVIGGWCRRPGSASASRWPRRRWCWSGRGPFKPCTGPPGWSGAAGGGCSASCC